MHSTVLEEEPSRRRITSSSIFEACIVVRGLPPTYECSPFPSSASNEAQQQRTVAEFESLKCCAELVSYAVLYNLALAHHMMAIKEVEKLNSSSSTARAEPPPTRKSISETAKLLESFLLVPFLSPKDQTKISLVQNLWALGWLRRSRTSDRFRLLWCTNLRPVWYLPM